MEKIHLDRLKAAEEFYRGKTNLAMVPISISIKDGVEPVSCSICLKNIQNSVLFGLTESEYRDIFLSQSDFIDERINKFLKEKTNAGLPN